MPQRRRRFFITTAIDYTNGAPHLGHAYEKILADVLARFARLNHAGDVFFLTGVDQHGQKVQQSAEKEGVAPQQFVDAITARFLALWQKLDVHYDGWAATTDPHHTATVRAILQRLWDEKLPNGESRWLYKAKRSGYYSVRQEQFLTDKERNETGAFGAEWGEVILLEEENYYFRLTEHRDWLLDLLDRRPDLIIPQFRRAELRNAVERLTGDLCISRPKSRLAWGIEIPFDPSFVTYVWFDALVNYISFAPGYAPAANANLDEFHRWWPALHVIGKDILVPAHGVYWPIMLKALGFTDAQMPTLLVHGWWNIAGAKMSKSLGNTVDPAQLAERYGAEALRYYLMCDIVTGRDADFSEDLLIARFNSDLANTLGNLLNRTLNMAWRYADGILSSAGADSESLAGIRAAAETHRCAYARDLRGDPVSESETRPRDDRFQVAAALQQPIALATMCNEFIDKSAPWKLAKDPARRVELEATLYALAESLRIIAILISPVLPRAAHGMFDQLEWKMDAPRDESRFSLADATWAPDKRLPDKHRVGKPMPLFPRIESAKG
jgi:methionyl-tRNA synthetase